MAFVHIYSVSHFKQSSTASSHLITSQVLTLHNFAVDSKCYLFAVDKKLLAILRLMKLLNESFR